MISSNDNWQTTASAAFIPVNYRPPNNAEAAIFTALAPGNYTAIVRGANGSTGVALVEAYDLDNSTTITLSNISSRSFVQTGANVMIAGLIVRGGDQRRIIVRALGPTLSRPPFNLANTLANPILDLRDANGMQIGANDNWKSSQQTEIQASGLAPPNDLESAIIISLIPGNYTAIVSGAGGADGNALVDLYTLN